MFIGPHTTRIRLDPITSSPISSTIRENACKNDVHLRFFTIEIRENNKFLYFNGAVGSILPHKSNVTRSNPGIYHVFLYS